MRISRSCGNFRKECKRRSSEMARWCEIKRFRSRRQMRQRDKAKNKNEIETASLVVTSIVGAYIGNEKSRQLTFCFIGGASPGSMTAALRSAWPIYHECTYPARAHARVRATCVLSPLPSPLSPSIISTSGDRQESRMVTFDVSFPRSTAVFVDPDRPIPPPPPLPSQNRIYESSPFAKSKRARPYIGGSRAIMYDVEHTYLPANRIDRSLSETPRRTGLRRLDTKNNRPRSTGRSTLTRLSSSRDKSVTRQVDSVKSLPQPPRQSVFSKPEPTDAAGWLMRPGR